MSATGPRLAKGEARGRVLVIDDDALVSGSLVEFLRVERYEASWAGSGEAGLEALAQGEESGEAIDVVICDVALPGMDGMGVLREARKRFRGTAVLMLTGYGTIESAVESLKLGAVDYLVKPVVDAELRVALARAMQQRALLAENASLRRRLEGRTALEHLVGTDPRMQRVYDLVEAVSGSKTTVLMTGESGTGKSLVARAIHERSGRRERPFVEISCGSIPETLLESELFGHVKGAFTGAHADKKGRFVAAEGGTIFLDEINSASAGMQLKLLRVLQERKFEPVGSTETIEVDVRVVLASNQPLEQLVAEGRFRPDLYYRINVVKIELPPLRERLSDVPALAAYFLEKHARELGKQVVGFTEGAQAALSRYSFPGNVRELQNIVERAAVLTRGQTITEADLPAHVTDAREGEALAARLRGDAALASLQDPDASAWVPMTLDEAMREPERKVLLKALRANRWNRQKTAEQLGINRTTLYKKMKALGIEGAEDASRGGV